MSNLIKYAIIFIACVVGTVIVEKFLKRKNKAGENA